MGAEKVTEKEEESKIAEKEDEKEEEEKEEDPDMLQLDANVDEDMELNKAPEIKPDDEKKEERKRRWKSDDKKKSLSPPPVERRRRHSNVKKEKESSPPPGEPAAVVHITNLVRPFTLPQLKDFLAVHGEYGDFWIDKIKSNCFVKYNEVDSAINCRKLIHGKKWPSSNPKSLRVTYSSDAKMQSAKEGTLEVASKRPDNIRREKRRSQSRSPQRATGMRSEQDFAKDVTTTKKREKSPEESAADESDEDEAGGICLDDLFKKTKTIPSVYWLPLTDQEIQARDDAREERKKAREERRKASEERRTKGRKRSRSKSGSKSRSRSRVNKRSRSRS